MVVVLIFAVLAQVVAGLFSADTDIGTVTGPLADLVADKWIERVTAFHNFWVNVLLVLVGLHVLAADRLSRVEAAEPDRRHDPRPQAARRRRRAPGKPAPALHFASGRLAISLLIACAADRLFHRPLGG